MGITERTAAAEAAELLSLRAEVDRLTRLRAHDVESVRQLRADCERLGADCDDALAVIETLRAEAALLREKLAAATTRVEELEESTAMACQSPADGCDCAGCLYAAERGGES